VQTAYVIAVSVLLVVLGALLYPTVHTMVGAAVDASSGWLPLTTAAATALPYFFLFIILYAVVKLSRK
jgi:hypothetical protein